MATAVVWSVFQRHP